MTRKGILILGHGSSYRYNERIMELQQQRLKEMGFQDVYIGYNKMSEPTIEESLSQMIKDGIDEVIAIPFFIASGLHMENEMPPKLGLEKGVKDGKVTIGGKEIMMHFGEPFGKDPLLTKILKEKICDLRTSDNAASIIIGHGSKLGYNKEVIMENAKRLTEMGVPRVYYAFNELNEPGIEEIVDKAIAEGADEIVALPLFISEGDHLKNDIPPKIHLMDGIREGTFRHDGKMIDVKYAEPIGKDPRLTELFAAKIRSY